MVQMGQKLVHCIDIVFSVSVPNLGFQLPLETPVPRVVTLTLLGTQKVQFLGFSDFAVEYLLKEISSSRGFFF